MVALACTGVKSGPFRCFHVRTSDFRQSSALVIPHTQGCSRCLHDLTYQKQESERFRA